MQRALDTIAIQIPVGKQREFVRANIVCRVNRAFNAIKSDSKSFDLDTQHAPVLKVV
jgi:hypothetical protein